MCVSLTVRDAEMRMSLYIFYISLFSYFFSFAMKHRRIKCNAHLSLAWSIGYDSYSKMKREHKYKDYDEYKDNDKDKDAERITESLTVCYIFRILITQAFQV